MENDNHSVSGWVNPIAMLKRIASGGPLPSAVDVKFAEACVALSETDEAAGLLKIIRTRHAISMPSPRPFDKEFLQLAGKAVQDKLPDNHGFVLLVASYGENGRLYYTSSIAREDAINLLKEWMIKCGAEEDWMKHIK